MAKTTGDIHSLLGRNITRTTGIGSLPHHNVDAALNFSLKMGIPFLPQIPIRNPWEFMIAQALDGLPGLQVDREGAVELNLDVWQSQSHFLDHRLRDAFARGPGRKDAFEGFEPSSSTSSCWQPFLWELQERQVPVGKVQISGPLTAQWALQLKGGRSLDQYPELGTQVFRLVLARALAVTYRMLGCGIQPILFLDEPGLYALNLKNPKHVLCLQELKLMIQTLRKEGALVGIHCCSNTDWAAVFKLGIDILSLDTQLSLENAASSHHGAPLQEFIQSGGILSLGVIPTARASALRSLDTHQTYRNMVSLFQTHGNFRDDFIQKTLKDALFTPACGLAFQSTSEAELILEKLVEVYEYVHLQ